MPFLGTILGWIGSGLVTAFGASVLQPILKTIQNGQDANRAVAETTITAEIQANNAKALIAPSFKGLIYLTAFPAIIHWAAVVADSLPWLPYFGEHRVGAWGVGALPETYQTIQGVILTAFFISSPITTLAKAGAAAMLKR